MKNVAGFERERRNSTLILWRGTNTTTKFDRRIAVLNQSSTRDNPAHGDHDPVNDRVIWILA